MTNPDILFLSQSTLCYILNDQRCFQNSNLCIVFVIHVDDVLRSTSVFVNGRISTHADVESPTGTFFVLHALPIRSILSFWGPKFPQMSHSLLWTPMNRRAKFDAASFILGGEIRNCTNTKKTVGLTDISKHIAYRHVWIISRSLYDTD